MLKVQPTLARRTAASLRIGRKGLEAVDNHICVTLLRKAFPCQSWIQTWGHFTYRTMDIRVRYDTRKQFNWYAEFGCFTIGQVQNISYLASRGNDSHTFLSQRDGFNTNQVCVQCIAEKLALGAAPVRVYPFSIIYHTNQHLSEGVR
jgi:hypothetical protein